MLEREQEGEKKHAKGKERQPGDWWVKKEGSRQTSVMYNIHDDVAVASEAHEEWPEQTPGNRAHP